MTPSAFASSMKALMARISSREGPPPWLPTPHRQKPSGAASVSASVVGRIFFMAFPSAVLYPVCERCAMTDEPS